MKTSVLFLLLAVLLLGYAAAQECSGSDCAPDPDGYVCPEAQRDCAGYCTRGYVRDHCGDCNGLDARVDANGTCCDVVERGCDNLCFSGRTLDACGVCGGNNATRDVDGVCCTGQMGCDGRCNSGLVLNDCGDCGGRTIRRSVEGVCCSVLHLDGDNHCCEEFDCEGRCGTAVRDACGVCNGNNATMDSAGHCCDDHQRGCDGLCFGASIDLCGHCGGGNRGCCGPDGRCSGHGVCSGEFRTCKCALGWTGANCTISQYSCDDVDCGPHGLCAMQDGVTSCVCDHRWTGHRCDTPRCADRGIFDPDTETCQCLLPFDAGTLCESCLAPKEGYARVCVELPVGIMPREMPRLSATMLLAEQNASMGGAPVRVFAPESEFEGVVYDCGCRPVAVHDANARYTQAAADEALSRLLRQEVKFFIQTNDELQTLVDNVIRSDDREKIWPAFIAGAANFLFGFVIAAVAITYAVVSQNKEVRKLIDFLKSKKDRN